MNQRYIAILIDGGFFLRRLPRIIGSSAITSPQSVAGYIRRLCKNHVNNLTGAQDARWHQYVYRIFYYDAAPYEGKSHHPLLNHPIDFANSDVARFRLALFDELRKQRKFALRLGKVNLEGDWTLPNHRVKKLLPTRSWFTGLDFSNADTGMILSLEQKNEALRLQKLWADIEANDVALGLRQKGVDMRIGLDIASITLKKQAQTIILVAGDSDFVPAAKFARREGMEFILDPLRQRVNPDLYEHIDGLHSGLPRPSATTVDLSQETEPDSICEEEQ